MRLLFILSALLLANVATAQDPQHGGHLAQVEKKKEKVADGKIDSHPKTLQDYREHPVQSPE